VKPEAMFYAIAERERRMSRPIGWVSMWALDPAIDLALASPPRFSSPDAQGGRRIMDSEAGR